MAKETGEQVSIGNFQIVDVNPWVDYLAEKIVGGKLFSGLFHFSKLLKSFYLPRFTPVLWILGNSKIAF